MTKVTNRRKPDDGERRRQQGSMYDAGYGGYGQERKVRDDDRDESFRFEGGFEKELMPEDPDFETESVFMSRLSHPRATLYSSKHNDGRISHPEKNRYVRGKDSSPERKLYNTEKMFSSREINRMLEKKTGYDDDSVLIMHRRKDGSGRSNAEQKELYKPRFDDDGLLSDSNEKYDSDSIFASRRGERVTKYSDEDIHAGKNTGGHPDNGKYSGRKAENSLQRIRRKKQKRKILAIVFSIIGAIVLALAIFAIVSIGDIKSLKDKAYSLKDEFGNVVECIGNKDSSGAEEASLKADKIIEEIEKDLEGTKFKIAAALPLIGHDVKAVGRVVELVEETNKEIIKPLISLTKDNPLDGLKVGDGFNVALINVYLDFLEGVSPKVTEIDKGFDGIKFNILDADGKMTNYLDKVHGLLDKFEIISENMPFIRAMLGDGSDRVYALVPQNNAEIRAAGGFPGIVGAITIANGILSVGEFEGVTQGGFYRWVDYDEAEITAQEEEIFCDWICNSYDASFIADFPRCGKIWSLAYRDAHGLDYVDGTVSMLPQVIQRILALLGKELTLSDGTVLTGENATKVLVHDLYYQYITVYNTYNEGNEIVDALLKEAAGGAMHMFVSEFGLDTAGEYFAFFEECFKDKTIQIWRADETDQQKILDAGAAGELNVDPENPIGGAYYSSCDTSKDGWFLDIITTVENPVVNPDSSRTYDVTVTYSNTMDYETYMNAPDSLVSYLDGAMQGHIQIFGPAGGTITDVSVSDGTELNYTVYKNLDCLYYQNFTVPQNAPITISCRMTTAPGVTTPLKMTTTPTLTTYR